MAGYATAFGRGLILGAGAALLYAAARESIAPARSQQLATRDPQADDADRLVDWDLATRLAIRASGNIPRLHPGARAQLQTEYEALLRDIEGPIADYTGTRLSLASTTIEIMDRSDWVRANMANFRELLQPIEEFYRETAGSSRGLPPLGMHHTARLVLSSQIGVLVGYLARRVLGQYDLALLGRDPMSGGKLFFVEPNLRHVEESLAIPRDELRRWIALHEATHAHEFELHPWVRTHMNNTLRRYLKLLVDDMRGRGDEGTLTVMLNRFMANLRRGHNLVAALMSPEQRELVSHLQALMSLAEGYSNHVMNGVGRTLLPNFDLIHERVEHRQRQRSQIEVLFLKVTGLAMKMEQYRLGERFVDEVVRERGIVFANRAWESADHLPTEVEIREPQRWIRRMEAVLTA